MHNHDGQCAAQRPRRDGEAAHRRLYDDHQGIGAHHVGRDRQRGCRRRTRHDERRTAHTVRRDGTGAPPPRPRRVRPRQQVHSLPRHLPARRRIRRHPLHGQQRNLPGVPHRVHRRVRRPAQRPQPRRRPIQTATSGKTAYSADPVSFVDSAESVEAVSTRALASPESPVSLASSSSSTSPRSSRVRCATTSMCMSSYAGLV